MGLYALNDENKKIPVTQAIKGEHYRCPDCLKDVFPVTGSSRAKAHFTHRAGEACVEYKYTRPTPWADKFIERFPEEYRNIPMEIGEKIFVADICKDKLVLLFQSGEGDAAEIQEKIRAFIGKGFYVAILVNAETDVYEQSLAPKDAGATNKLKWLKPPVYLKGFVPQNEKEKLAVLLYLADAEHSQTSHEDIERVIWTPDGGNNSWHYIVVDDYEKIELTESLKAGDIFDSPFKRAWDYVEAKKVDRFYELYSGEKGKGSAEAYKCPKVGRWLQPISECKKCGHCLCIVFYSKADKKCNKVYCAYEQGKPGGKAYVKTFGHY